MIEASWSVPTHFDNPALVKLGGDVHQPFQGNVEIRHSFVNNLNVPVTIVLRSGFRFQLVPEPDLYSSALIARTEITVRGKSIDSVSAFLSAVNENSTPELQTMREAFRIQAEYSHVTKGAVLMLDYPITVDTLRDHGGTVYYSELDMVVSLQDIFGVCEHPYSQAGRDAALANSLPIPVDGLDFNYMVTIVDNAGKAGPRWLNINNTVYKVTPKMDSTRTDGVYIASSQPADGIHAKAGLSVRRYSFDEADHRLGIYASAEEARTLGDMVANQKKTLLEMEQNLLQGKQERELEILNQKREYEKLLAASEKEKIASDTLRREAEAKQLKLEEEAEKRRVEMKDLYEERSQRRKDSGESLKFLPNLIIGLGAVFLAIRSFG